MFKRFRKRVATLLNSRLLILSVLFVVLACVLVRRLFDLQIVNGETYQESFTTQIRKETTIPSTRGCIYDSDGKLIAYNKLAYEVTFQDVGSYEGRNYRDPDTNTEEYLYASDVRNLTINGYLYQIMQILYANGDDVYTGDFAVELDDAGEYSFTKSG